MRFLQLFHRYIIRDLLRNRPRVALTISGVALGIGVVVAVQLANARAIDGFNDSLRLIAGQADLQISANGLPLPETLMRELAWVWDRGSMSPFLEGRAVLELNGLPVQVLGVDLLSEWGFRRYVLQDRTDLSHRITHDEFVSLLVDPSRVILPAALAQRLRVEKESSFDVLIRDKRQRFIVGAILSDEGVARAFSGDVLFLDIAAAQQALGKVGLLDRIDIHLRNRTELDAVRERIAKSLPATALVDAPEAGALQNEKLSRAFRYNLTALSYVSLFVGIILIYNTLTIAVVRRRPEIGMFRAMGSSRRTIAALFLLEAGLFGLVGAVAGIAVGQVLSRGAGILVDRTLQSLYSNMPVTGSSSAGWSFYVQALAGGLLLAVASGLLPALRATTLAPAAVLREGMMFVRPPRRMRTFTAAGLMAIGAAAFTARQPTVMGFPYLGYVAALFLIVGFGLLTPVFSQLVSRFLKPPLERIFPIEGRLALQSMRSSVSRIVSAVLSLAIAAAMLTSVVTMVSSFRDTVIVWINQTLRADLYIRAGASGSNDWSNPFRAETVDAVAALPQVAAIDRFRARQVQFKDTAVVVGGGDFSVLGRYSDLLFLDGRTAAEVAPRMLNQDRVIVSEPFAMKQRVTKGDVIPLPTAEGAHPFQIEAVYYDYSNDRGLVVMDRSTYVRLFHDESVTNITLYLKPGIDAMEAQRQIAFALPDAGLRVITNAELKKQVLRVFDQTFQITYALEVIALIASILGITNTLSALILERRQEFAMLRFIGADRRQVRRMVVVEGGVIGVVGVVMGLALGLALSLVLIFVINKQSFGWTIQFTLPGWFFLQSSIAIVAATVLAGFYPAALATRLDPIQGIRAE